MAELESAAEQQAQEHAAQQERLQQQVQQLEGQLAQQREVEALLRGQVQQLQQGVSGTSLEVDRCGA